VTARIFPASGSSARSIPWLAVETIRISLLGPAKVQEVGLLTPNVISETFSPDGS
jgi:hypothetical protein